HKENIGVILDWVPGHFCRDSHGLAYFDGAACYEYAEGWKADNKGWGTLNFDLGRPEVRSFLISNAIYWIKEFHIDGFRMDAVTNMIYLSYGRNHGEWIQNSDGTDINYDGVSFIRELNSHIIEKYPNIMLCAEESTTFPKVSFPVSEEGLGFHFKWNMGWMNDTLTYIEDDPIYRQYIHEKMNFSMAYHYNENFILPLSHDEVVHGKKSLVNKMWGDYFNKFAGFRAYMIYKMGHPGKKLLFMGGEIGQFIEWNSTKELDWHLVEKYEMHKNIQRFFKDLNKFYLHNSELWSRDYESEGFNWIDPDNRTQSIYSFIRKGKQKNEILVVLINFTPRYYENYEIEVPKKGTYIEVFNSDNNIYGGSGKINLEKSTTYEKEVDKLPYKIKIKIPPMGGMILRYEGEK
ncbi:MAG: 1,4-alpha-glucan branching protein GlgB, partial [Clostridium sp.]|uniref:1,4-alpha-glucan branching protein GlgB n=1 Tax=Clostridium sp. TaxID=1506 RepID=UPI003EE6D3A3